MAGALAGVVMIVKVGLLMLDIYPGDQLNVTS